jgi:hypothetical protein
MKRSAVPPGRLISLVVACILALVLGIGLVQGPAAISAVAHGGGRWVAGLALVLVALTYSKRPARL